MPRGSKRCLPSDQQLIKALDQQWVITLEDIKDDWTAIMTKRLLKEVNRQLAAMESVKYDKTTGLPKDGNRLVNARTLASLQQTLKELMRMKAQQDVMAETRKVRRNVEYRQEIKLIADQRMARKEED